MILNVKILNEKPPIYDMLRENGLNFKEDKTIFTYGDAIYNPANIDIPQDLIAHEMEHMRQQREIQGGPEMWWARYIQDPLWRIQQEVEAYRVQYQYFCSKKKSRDAQLRVLVAIGNVLGSATYGNVVTPAAAIRLIQSTETL